MSPSNQGGRLNFEKFETEKIKDCVTFVKKVMKELREVDPSTPRVIKGWDLRIINVTHSQPLGAVHTNFMVYFPFYFLLQVLIHL